MKLLANILVLIAAVVIIPYIFALFVLQLFSFLIESALFGKMRSTKPWWRRNEKDQKSSKTSDSGHC